MIYMDNAATTPVCKNAYEAMLPYFSTKFGNPSGAYELGRKCRKDIENARETIASSIGARPGEIYFTSGGTESDNWAIMSTMLNEIPGIGVPHMITSKIEHSAVMNTCKQLEKYGVEVTYLDVDEYGLISLNQLKSAIKKNTRLISIMYANNEIGTIEPITEIGRIANYHNIIFHTDAVQAFAHVNINVNRSGIDMLSASSHKFGGPKGVGFLYIRNTVDIEPLIFGGGQEMGKRSGTENVAGIVGMAEACRYRINNLNSIMNREVQLRNYMIDKLVANKNNREIRCSLNGHPVKRLPGNINITIPGKNAKKLVEELNRKGICISAGSACSAMKDSSSHVLKAIGLSKEMAESTIRITLSENNTREETDIVIKAIMF
ncbi:MAG: cysteine desulfurase [Lachnospiraceae bacterium]|nr:cysteine desulfurase [Lachnospiraceae bacterium]